jgi:hypothetical protein
MEIFPSQIRVELLKKLHCYISVNNVSEKEGISESEMQRRFQLPLQKLNDRGRINGNENSWEK